VEPILGDCAEVTPVGVADRVVMGMVRVTDRYLWKGIQALRPGGILHYHQTVPSVMHPAQAVQDVTEAAKNFGKASRDPAVRSGQEVLPWNGSCRSRCTDRVGFLARTENHGALSDPG